MNFFNKRFLSIFLLLAIQTCLIFAYDWPMDEDNDPSNGVVLNTQHQINAHLAECRQARDHFHSGVDINGIQGTRIYAIEDGTARVAGLGVNVGHFRYYHLMNIAVSDYDTIGAGDLLGYTDSGNHLHIMESNIVLTQAGLNTPNVVWINLLREGGLYPFVDNTDPVIEGVTFWQQGTNNQITNGNLFGYIDIIVDAYDPRTSTNGGNAGGHCGIYSLSIEIWSNGNLLGDPIAYHIYDELPTCNINLIYAEGSSSINFLYWATNDPYNEPINKYWNTRQKKNHDYTFDASISEDNC